MYGRAKPAQNAGSSSPWNCSSAAPAAIASSTSLRDGLTNTATGVTSGGRLSTMALARSGVTQRGLGR